MAMTQLWLVMAMILFIQARVMTRLKLVLGMISLLVVMALVMTATTVEQVLIPSSTHQPLMT